MVFVMYSYANVSKHNSAEIGIFMRIFIFTMQYFMSVSGKMWGLLKAVST